MNAETTHKIYLGSRITKLALDETGQFYDQKDERMTRPLRVTPIKDGLNAFSLFRHQQQYGPSREEEINYEVAGLALCLATEEQILAGQIGARTNEKSDTIAIDFYKIHTLG
jgi:hypothetical protein